jgi:hypothetical protein
MKISYTLFTMAFLTICSCQMTEKKKKTISKENTDIKVVQKKDSIHSNIENKTDRDYASLPIPELLDFVIQIEKMNWKPDTLRLKKVDFYNYLKQKTLFNNYPFYKISFHDTEMKKTYEYDSELLLKQSNIPKNKVDIELFKDVKSIWGYFYRGNKIGNSISDGVIEQWEFNTEEDAERALNQIKLAGHLVYFNTIPFHCRIKNYLFTFRTRAMTFSLEQEIVFEKFKTKNCT